ncbi:hypothetical protein SeLEV6574_g04208 [Synchytrium endobioticum]|uniref:Ribosome biogenesis protein YTM1 n=1 Tax=Synchytrium endobioticum TaxID=286115 RepID=A0A507D0E2_9FUNG|nr:hypothetical protein SeLEV6574_g04208 [Synchytrium endobioticum]
MAIEDNVNALNDEHREQVQVRLKSRDAQYAVPAAPLLIPTRVKRVGLSSIVNQLLQSDKQISFDFLIDNKFLRSSIHNYLIANDLTTESVLDIEYIPSQPKPTPSADTPHPDWIASIVANDTSQMLVTGGFDGKVRIWDYSHNNIGEIDCNVKNKKGVKAVALQSKGVEDMVVLVGGADSSEKVGAWQILGQTVTKLYDAVGHHGAIESLDVSNSHFATSSWDGIIAYWTIERPTDEDSDDDLQEVDDDSSFRIKQMRKRKWQPPAPVKTPVLTFEGHSGCVSVVKFRKQLNSTSSENETVMYSGGWDHSVRIWDVAGRANTLTMNCESVITCMDYSAHSGLIATGHTDNLIRLWDPRTQDGFVVKLKLASHKSWVSAIQWSPSSAYMLASASFDSTIKVWDVRSTTPFYTIAGSEDNNKKLFAMEWTNRVMLAGGEEGVLKSWSF